MLDQLETKILNYANNFAGVKKADMEHGTLFVHLEDFNLGEIFYLGLRKFFKDIDSTGGVNMWFLNDESVYDSENNVLTECSQFAFDFVPEEDEVGYSEPQGSQIDTMLNLENEMALEK